MPIKVRKRKNPTVFRYPGGKNSFREQFARVCSYVMPEKFPLGRLLSGFGGGLSIELEYAKTGKDVVVTEKDPIISGFWIVAKYQRPELLTKINNVIEKYCETQGNRHFVRRGDPVKVVLEMMDSPDPVERAAGTFIYNRIVFGGDMTNPGQTRVITTMEHQRLTKNSIRRLAECDLIRVTIIPGDWSQAAKEEGLFYGDPPYPEIVTDLYEGHETFDHERLAEALLRRGSFLLSYNDVETAERLYGNKAHFVPLSWTKDAGDGETKGINKELIIFSKDLCDEAKAHDIVARAFNPDRLLRYNWYEGDGGCGSFPCLRVPEV